jgi:hypothetical protein
LFIDEAFPGDLEFFDNNEGKICHMGIIMTNKQIIHLLNNIGKCGQFVSDVKLFLIAPKHYSFIF